MPERGLEEQNIQMYFSIIGCKKYVATSQRRSKNAEQLRAEVLIDPGGMVGPVNLSPQLQQTIDHGRVEVIFRARYIWFSLGEVQGSFGMFQRSMIPLRTLPSENSSHYYSL